MEKTNTLLLDTGNLLYNRYNEIQSDSYSVKHDIIIEAMNIMKYDGLNLVVNDISPDLNLLDTRVGKIQFPIISANAKIFESCISDSMQKYFIKEINGIRIGITGVMPMIEQNSLLEKSFNIKEPEKALESIIPILAEKTDFIILLSQLTSEETVTLLNSIPAIDLGLCIDSIPQPLPVENTDSSDHSKDSPSLMTITTRGMELGILNIEKTGEQVKIIDARRISLDKKVASDESMLKLTSQFKVWKAAKAATNKKAQIQIVRKTIDHQKLMENLDQTPEDFFKKNKKTVKK